MKTFDEIRDTVLDKIHLLAVEATVSYEEIVLPRWDEPDWSHRFPRTLYGYCMNAFAFVDLLSWCRTGSLKQSPRMVDLLVDYLGYGTTESAVSVKLWRHTLMHTGDPCELLEKSRQRLIRWLMHWKDHLPSTMHMTIHRGPGFDVLNTGVLYLIEDLGRGAAKLFTDLGSNAADRQAVGHRHEEVTHPEIDI